MARDNGQALGAAGQLTALVSADGSTGGFVKDSDLGTNVAAFLATPSSANLAAALTDEVGTAGVAFTAEGTWTPVLTFATAGDLSVVYTEQVGSYVRIGNLVIVTANINTSTFTYTTAVGSLQVTGLPFTSKNVTNDIHFGACAFAGFTKAGYGEVVAVVSPNTSLVTFTACGTGVAAAGVSITEVASASNPKFRFTVAYQI